MTGRPALAKRITPGDGDPRHGTANGYSNLGCRCVDCKKAQRKYEAAGCGHIGPNATHGTCTTYGRGCRCADCRKAAADYKWRLRRRNAEKEGRTMQERDWVIEYRLGRIA